MDELCINKNGSTRKHKPEVVFNRTRDRLHFPLALLVIQINAVRFPPIYAITSTFHKSMNNDTA